MGKCIYDESMPANVSATPVYGSSCHARITVGIFFLSCAYAPTALHRMSMQVQMKNAMWFVLRNVCTI